MKGLGRPKTGYRPAEYPSVVERIRNGEINQGQAAEILGVTRQTIHRYLSEDYPDEFRGKYRTMMGKRTGKANQKYISWLEGNIKDKDLCEFIRMKGKCPECPRKCVTNRMSKGLGKLISETRVPLKDIDNDVVTHDSNTLRKG